MIRRLFVGVLVLAMGGAGFALAASPAQAQAYAGGVVIDCTGANANGIHVLNRDNTGNGREALQVLITDGNGIVLLSRQIAAPLGTYPGGLGRFTYTTRPTRNPIRFQLYSIAGHGLSEQLPGIVAQGNCIDPYAPFVRAAYRDFLDRDPTPSELQNETSALAAGLPHTFLATRLSVSFDYLNGLVNDLYVATLGRPADPSGLSYWTTQLGSGSKLLADVTASFYGSGEYFRGIGGGTYESWVRDMYNKLLRRPSDPAGVAFWAAQARKSRTKVAYGFFQSTESRRFRVDALFVHFLGRAPTAEDAALWSLELLEVGDIEAAAEIVAGIEYAFRANACYAAI